MSRALVLCSMLLLLASRSASDVIPLVGKTPEKRPPELVEAEKVFQGGDYEKCLELLESATRKYPELAPAPLLLARLFIAAGQLPPAGRALFDRAAVKQPNHPAVYLALAQINLAEGRFVEASALIDKSLGLSETNKDITAQRTAYLRECHAGKAHIAEQRQDWLAAQQALLDWLKVEPKHAQARQRLGRALFHLGRPPEALDQLQQAYALDGRIEHPFVSMGLLWTQKKDVKQADQWMQRALKEGAKDTRTRLAVASWLLDQERIDEAAAGADAVLRIEPGSVDARRLRGLVYRYQRNFAAAERVFEPLYQESPGDFFLSNQLVLALAEQADAKKTRRALQLAEVNARQYPNLGEAQATLGRVHYLLGQWTEADKAMQNALRSGRLSSDAAYYYGCILDQLKRGEEAQKVLKAAVEASGPFLYRKEARELLGRLEKK